MKKLAWQIIVLGAVFLAGYLYFTAVIRVGDGEFALVRDNKTGEFSLLKPGISFIWQGAVPGRALISRNKSRQSEIMDIRVPIPSLADLKSDVYTIRVPLSLVYDLDLQKLSIGPEILGKDRNAPGILLRKTLEGYFTREFSKFLDPFYNRPALLQFQQVLVKGAMESLQKHAERIGIRIISFEMMGTITAPDEKLYYEGILFQRELQELDRTNKKELITLKNNLDMEKQTRKDYLEKLSEVSRLLKSNPELLKYIYIDRLAGNVKVIITPERTGMPFGLDLDEKSEGAPKKGEIDNLR